MTTDINAVVEKYIAYRDLLDKRAAARAEEDKPYIEAMQLLEGAAAIQLRALDVRSMKTEHGTVYQSTTMAVRVADREALMNYVREADAFDILAANIAKDALKDHMDEHQGMTPPGVELTYVTKTLFRRA